LGKPALKPSLKLQTTIWYIKCVCVPAFIVDSTFHLGHTISLQKSPADAMNAQIVG
jgi:hypothetical protein